MNRFRMAMFFVAAAAVFPGNSACQQARSVLISTSQNGAGQILIRGSLLDSVSGAPLSGAHLRFIPLSSISQRVVNRVYGAATSNLGEFSIKNLPAGAYFVSAQKNGFELLPFREQGAPQDDVIAVKTDEEHQLRLKMVQRATLAGHVFDVYGEPVPDLSVEARPSANDARRLAGSRQAKTDDNGAFRLAVLPGRYYLFASLAGGPTLHQEEIRTVGRAEVSYRDTYYPGASTMEAATAVNVKPGEQSRNLDIRLVVEPVRLTIGGVITGIPDGAKSLSVTIESGQSREEVHQAITQGFSVDNTSSAQPFSFSDLQPGFYRVYAASGTGDKELESQVEEVALSDSAVKDLDLLLTPAFSITGTIEVSQSQGAKIKPGRRAVTLASVPSLGQGPRTGEVDHNGVFTISGLKQQLYRVAVKPLDGNEYVKSVRLGTTEFADEVVDLRNGGRGATLKVAISEDGAEISGSVTEENAPITRTMILAPDRKGITRTDLRYAFAGLDGRYRFRGVRPGRFRLFDFDPSTNPEDQLRLIRENAGNGRVIEVRENDKRTEDFAVTKKKTGGDDTTR